MSILVRTFYIVAITASLFAIGGQVLGFFVNWNTLKTQRIQKKLESVKA